MILQQTWHDMMLVALLCEHRIEKEQHGIFSTEDFNEVMEEKKRKKENSALSQPSRAKYFIRFAEG